MGAAPARYGIAVAIAQVNTHPFEADTGLGKANLHESPPFVCSIEINEECKHRTR